MRRTVIAGIGIIALAAGAAPGQSAGSGGGSAQEAATALYRVQAERESAQGGQAAQGGRGAGRAPAARPGPDASINTIRSYVQAQQQARLEIDGEPVTLRVTGASLQVYLGDEPYPESRMKAEDKRTLLLDSSGKPAGQMLVEGQRARLTPVNGAQQAEGRLLIGVALSPVDPTLARHLKIEPEKASQISSVTEGWPASAAGLGAGDIIVSVEGSDEGTPEALRSAIAERKAGDAIKLGVISGGERKDVTITLSDEARSSTVFGVASVASPLEVWGLAGQYMAPTPAGQAATEYAVAQSEQYRQRAQELRASESRKQAAAQAGQYSVEVAEAQVRALREQLAAAQRDGRPNEVAQAQVQALREQLAAAQRGAMADVAISEGARVTVDIPSGGGRAVVAPRPEGDISRRLSALEERMARIETLLQKLTEQSGGR